MVYNIIQLENGQFIKVPCLLVKRLNQHFIKLPFGIDIIIGNNGYIWVARNALGNDPDNDSKLSRNSSATEKTNVNISLDVRERIVRVVNSVKVLA